MAQATVALHSTPLGGTEAGPKVTKNFMLNLAEHESLNAHKYEKYQEIQHFSGSVKPIMLFVLFINVKMPTVVGTISGILTLMSRKSFMVN